MKKIFIFCMLTLLSLPAFAVNKAVLEHALTNAASEYAYEDDGFSCGGDIYSYKIISQDKFEIVVAAKISAAVSYCSKTIELNCVGTFNLTKNGKELIYKDFYCDEASL